MPKLRSLSAFAAACTAVVACFAVLQRADASARPGEPPRDSHGDDAKAAASTSVDAHASATHAASSTASPDELWYALADGNLRFVASAPRHREYATRRAELAESQHPAVMVLCCADSRVSPELVFDQSLGDLFVVREAGNVADSFAVASLEYAAEHLGARLLVVMGHERCGAVKAAASGDLMPTPSLQSLVERIRPAFERVPAGEVGAAHLLELQVEANVRQSALDVLAGSRVLLDRVAAGELSIVKCVYDLDSGEVRRVY